MNNRKLMQLARDNKRPENGLDVRSEGDDATIRIYDVIDDWWGVSAESIARALDAITASTINVRLNCPGGDVFEARAMKTLFETHDAKIIMHVDGLAASAASYLMFAGDEKRIANGAMVMIHNPWSFAWGEASELRKTADLLDKIRDTLADDYETATGKARAEIISWMDAETWFEASEAVEHGFCDTVVQKGQGASAAASWNLAAYANTPAPKDRDDAGDIDTEIANVKAKSEARLGLLERTAA